MQNEIISNVLMELVVDHDNKQLMKLKDVLGKTLSNLKIESICSNECRTNMLGVVVILAKNTT